MWIYIQLSIRLAVGGYTKTKNFVCVFVSLYIYYVSM